MSLANVQKQQMANFILTGCPFMTVKHTTPGVELPEFLMSEGLVLRIGRDPAVLGMPDLVINDNGWSGTLSVQGARHFVTIPWEAVDRMWLSEGPIVYWPPLEEKQIADEVKVKANKPALRLVPANTEEPTTAATSKEEAE
jgi:hypothetical protein